MNVKKSCYIIKTVNKRKGVVNEEVKCIYFGQYNDVATLNFVVAETELTEKKITLDFGEKIQLSVNAYDMWAQEVPQFNEPLWVVAEDDEDNVIGTIDPTKGYEVTFTAAENSGDVTYLEGSILVQVEREDGEQVDAELFVIVGEKEEEE